MVFFGWECVVTGLTRGFGSSVVIFVFEVTIAATPRMVTLVNNTISDIDRVMICKYDTTLSYYCTIFISWSLQSPWQDGITPCFACPVYRFACP